MTDRSTTVISALPPPAGHAPQAAEVEVDLRAVLRASLHAFPWLFLLSLLLGAGTYALLSAATPRYAAQTTLLIEAGESDITRQPDPAETATLLDQEGIASQVQLIRSRDLSRAVIEKLNLAALPEFNPTLRPPSGLTQILESVGLGPDHTAPVEERVLANFVDHLNAFPVDRTRVIGIEFTSSDARLAADVANAVAEEYIAMQRTAKRQTTADATEWLEREISLLSERVKEAEGKVEAFRSGSDLFIAGVNNTTLAQQQLGDLSSELSRVRAARAEAEAKAAQIRASLANGTAFTSSDVLNSALIQRLREQQVALQAAEAEASATMLSGHPRLRQLRAQLADLDGQIRSEARKVLTALEGDASLAERREQEISQQLNALKSVAATSNDAEVQLRALERDAAAQRDLLQTYLLRYREAISRQNSDYQPADARIISRATAPVEPYFPKKLPMTAGAVIIAMILGFLFVLVRELASGRSLRQVAQAAPMVPAMPVIPYEVPVNGRLRWSETGDVRRIMPRDPQGEALMADRMERSLGAVAARLTTRQAKRVLVTMAERPGEEGRPLAAVALARTLARGGARVVLVDLRQDNADRVAMGEADTLPGFADLFRGEASFAQVIFRDRVSPAHFIPAGEADLPEDFATGDRLRTLIDALDHTYDHVIYDVDERALAVLGPSAAAVIIVTEVGPTDPRTVRAYDAIAAVTAADVMLLVADPAPPGAAEATGEEAAADADVVRSRARGAAA